MIRFAFFFAATAFYTLVCAQVHSSDSAVSGQSEKPIPELKTVVVSGEKTGLDEKGSDRVLFSSDIKKYPLVDNDVFRAVQAQPGVSSDEFSARFSVRGGDRDETLVVVDGMELFYPYHLQDYGGAVSVLDLLAVSKVELYSGAFSSEYGDKMSAVLKVDTRTPSNKRKMDAGIDLINAHVFYDHKPVFLSVRAGYIGILMGLMQSDEKLQPHYGDVLFRIDKGGFLNGSLSSYVLYSGDLNTIDKEGVEDDVKSGFNNLTLWSRYQRFFSSGWNLQVYPYGGLYIQERQRGTADMDDRTLRFGGLKVKSGLDITESIRLQAGLETRWMLGKYDYRDPGENIRIDVEKEDVAIKGYALATFKISPNIRWNWGTRILHHIWENRWDVGPHTAFTFAPSRYLKFRAAWGVYYQPVDPLHIPVEAGEDTRLPSEQSTHYVIGGQYRHDSLRLNVRLEGYHKSYENLTGFIRNYGRQEQLYIPREKGEAWGIETITDKGFGKFLVHTGYAYSVSEVSDTAKTFYAEEDTRHAFKAGLSYSLGPRWQFYCNFTWHSGNPYTPRDTSNGALIPLAPNSKRLPNYHSLSVRVTRIWKGKITQTEAYLQVLNLYNRKNVHEYAHTLKKEDEEWVFMKSAEGLFPVLPTIGVNVRF